MSKCRKCGAETKEGAKFCKSCGNDLAGTSPSLSEKKNRVMEREMTWVKPTMIIGVILLLVAGAWLTKGIVMAKNMNGRPS